MYRVFRCKRRAILLCSSSSIPCGNPRICAHANQSPSSFIMLGSLRTGSYVNVSGMRKSAFEGNVSRLIRDEIQYEIDHSPPPQFSRARSLCTRNENGGNNGEKIDSNNGEKIDPSVAHYRETYKKLDNLDFMTAAQIVFSDSPKKKKFGLDFHLVQLFFACLPSLAVYLVAQYARRKMKEMDAELHEKKTKEEEQKAKEEAEQAALEEQEKSKTDAELEEVKVRLGKLEESIKEMVVESKKHSGGNLNTTQEDQSSRGKPTGRSESSKEKHEKQKDNEQKADQNQRKAIEPASESDHHKGKMQNARAQEAR